MRAPQYFAGIADIAEIRSEYHRLAKLLHPDLHPELGQEPMKDLNNQYQAALKGQHGSSFQGFDQEPHTYYYNEATETETMRKVMDALAAKLPDHVIVELIGTWIWVTGTSATDMETRGKLKGLGFAWHSKRAAWYWRKFEYRTKFNAHIGLDDMRRSYGSKTFHADEAAEEPRRPTSQGAPAAALA